MVMTFSRYFPSYEPKLKVKVNIGNSFLYKPPLTKRGSEGIVNIVNKVHVKVNWLVQQKERISREVLKTSQQYRNNSQSIHLYRDFLRENTLMSFLSTFVNMKRVGSNHKNLTTPHKFICVLFQISLHFFYLHTSEWKIRHRFIDFSFNRPKYYLLNFQTKLSRKSLKLQIHLETPETLHSFDIY